MQLMTRNDALLRDKDSDALATDIDCCCYTCSTCPDPLPSQIALTLGGIVNQSPLKRCHNATTGPFLCDNCTILNGTFILDLVFDGFCHYHSQYPIDPCFDGAFSNCATLGLDVTISLDVPTDTVSIVLLTSAGASAVVSASQDFSPLTTCRGTYAITNLTINTLMGCDISGVTVSLSV